MNWRLLAAAAMEMVGLMLAVRLTRWRGFERQLIGEYVTLGLVCITLIILFPVVTRGNTRQVLLAIVLAVLPAIVLINALTGFAN